MLPASEALVGCLVRTADDAVTAAADGASLVLLEVCMAACTNCMLSFTGGFHDHVVSSSGALWPERQVGRASSPERHAHGLLEQHNVLGNPGGGPVGPASAWMIRATLPSAARTTAAGSPACSCRQQPASWLALRAADAGALAKLQPDVVDPYSCQARGSGPRTTEGP
jgi:hypothetical protein